MVGLTSAAGLVSLLQEPDPSLRVFALKRLDDYVDLFWPEIANSVGGIEALYEDDAFPQRDQAALLASKVYYHLGEYNESMVFALKAGKLFDINREGEFEETIISKCIDTYIQLSAAENPATPTTNSRNLPSLTTSFPTGVPGGASTSVSMGSPTTPFSQSVLPSKSLLSRQPEFNDAASTGGASPLALDKHDQRALQLLVESLFEKCYTEGRHRQVVGIALEARNLGVLRSAILRASADQKKTKQEGLSEELMEYVLDICMTVVQERGFRNEILKLILELLNQIPTPDYFSIAKCVVYLNEQGLASELMRQLVKKGDQRSVATAYQLAFDLYDNGTQEFLSKVRTLLPTDEESPEDEEASESQPLLQATVQDAVDVDAGAPKPKLSKNAQIYERIASILRGTKSIELNLEFLYRNNHADTNILNRLKESLEARNSMFHSAVTFSNAFMNAGTTSDGFFRQNLEWLGRAVNWSKFSATAALGVIHKGNLSQGKTLLAPYLPRDTPGAGSSYSQGGSLFALGLIYANHGADVLDDLRQQLRTTQDDVIQHGGALGVGVAGMATGNDQIYDELDEVLQRDQATNGESVGIAMGLVMLGTGSVRALENMIGYAHSTGHEKIVRGLGLGMALIMYGRQEAADDLITGLLDEPDPTLRYGGVMTVAMAYCGTSSNKAVRKLLHIAVSDVSDDVRRVAVMSLGFILFRKPSSVPRMVELLSESYNPHVRYGAAMALGISCAGTGLDEAIDLLEPMIKDPTDFVRQGALIALSMILIQQNETMNPKVGSTRKMFQRIVSDKHEDAMAKFGAALALGIIDGGGRNCTIGLQTQTGNLNMPGIVGMAVFTQYWYWFPYTHFLALSFTPTSVIGLDHNLEIPAFKFHSNTRPSLFDYPPEQEVKGEEAPEKVATAVLSTTAKAKQRAQRKERQARGDTMELDQATPGPEKDPQDEDKSEDKPDEKEVKKEKEKEKVGYRLENMSRVLPAQLKFISFPDERYRPVKKPTGGVILLVDNKPDEPKTLLELKAKKAAPVPTPGTRAHAGAEGGLAAAVAAAVGQSIPGGASAAAPVLTAIDEDLEGGEEAEVPLEFDYYSDEEEGGPE